MITELQQLAEHYLTFFEIKERDDRTTFVTTKVEMSLKLAFIIDDVCAGSKNNWKYIFIYHSLEVIADTDVEFYEYTDNLNLDPTPYVALQWVAFTSDKAEYVERAFNDNLGLERAEFDFLEVVKDGYCCEVIEVFYTVLGYLQQQVGE